MRFGVLPIWLELACQRAGQLVAICALLDCGPSALAVIVQRHSPGCTTWPEFEETGASGLGVAVTVGAATVGAATMGAAAAGAGEDPARSNEGTPVDALAVPTRSGPPIATAITGRHQRGATLRARSWRRAACSTFPTSARSSSRTAKTTRTNVIHTRTEITAVMAPKGSLSIHSCHCAPDRSWWIRCAGPSIITGVLSMPNNVKQQIRAPRCDGQWALDGMW